MSVKRVLIILTICILTFAGNQSTFASSNFVDRIDPVTVMSPSISNESINVTYKIDNIENIHSSPNQDIVLGKKYLVKKYPDGSLLTMVAEISTPIRMLEYLEKSSSGPTYVQSRQFTYYYTNILGVTQIAYTVNIETTFVSDLEFGYIISMTGSYNLYSSSFILQWTELPDYATYHAVGLDSYYNGNHGYSIFSSIYNHITGQLTISVTNY